MTQLTDHQLLDRFHAQQDPAALNEIARRYIGLVYSSARRQVRDAHLAEDITQAVFIVLVRNAGSIRRDAILSSWLHSVTRHAVNNALRVQSRRRAHETRKVLMENESSTSSNDASIAEEVRPHLDEAIARLPHGMRDSVMLYFFGNRTHKQVGEALGLSEDAARKRIGRALDRMKEMLVGRGIGVAVSSLAISSTLSIESAAVASAAPSGLLASTVNIALLSNTFTASAGGGAIAASIAQGVGKVMTLTKIKIAAAVAGAALITGASTVPIVQGAGRLFTAPIVTQTAVMTLVDSQAAPSTQPAQAASGFVAEINDQTKITILGISSYPPGEDTWFAPDGTPIDCPRPSILGSGSGLRTRPEAEFALLLKIEKPHDTHVKMEIDGAPMVGNSLNRDSAGEELMLTAFRFDGAPQSFGFRIGVSDTPWKTVAASETPTEQKVFDAPDIGQVTFEPVEAHDEGCQLAASYPGIREPNHIIVIDDEGKEHAPENINVKGDGQQWTATCTYKIAPEKVKQVHLQTRQFNKHIEARDISLEKDHKTTPVLKVTEEGK